MRVPAHQDGEAEQNRRAAGPYGDSLWPRGSQDHKNHARGARKGAPGPQIIESSRNAAMFPLYFPEKKPRPDVVKVTASGRAGPSTIFFGAKIKKALTANKKGSNMDRFGVLPSSP